ncbi:MAG: glycosyltransferase, partial [Gammaproteobacteria bacterium]
MRTPLSLSVVIPAKNEAGTVGTLVARRRAALPQAEVVVVDDGSSDDTGAVAAAAGARVVRHPVSRGNGAAIKAGARAASGELLAFMDADGQHGADSLPALLSQIEAGYDMAVGARAGT